MPLREAVSQGVAAVSGSPPSDLLHKWSSITCVGCDIGGKRYHDIAENAGKVLVVEAFALGRHDEGTAPHWPSVDMYTEEDVMC